MLNLYSEDYPVFNVKFIQWRLSSVLHLIALFNVSTWKLLVLTKVSNLD